MIKFKVGDEVVLVKPREDPDVLKNGVTGVVLDLDDYPYIQFNVDQDSSLHDAGGLGEDGKCYSIDQDELELITNQYEKSNRNKLREHIKSLGFSAIDLSVAAGFNKAYFGSETGESRFNSRGDISDDRLLELKHNAFSAMMQLKIEKSGYRNGGYVDRKITPSDFCLHGSQPQIHLAKQNSKIPKILKRVEKPKSKWIVSNKVFFTFVFFFVLLISLAITGIVKQVF